jgi:uncharacterized protein YggT (Ycf19 family)
MVVKFATMRNVRNFFLQNEINNEIWAFLARITKRNLVLFKRITGQGQVVRGQSLSHLPKNEACSHLTIVSVIAQLSEPFASIII